MRDLRDDKPASPKTTDRSHRTSARIRDGFLSSLDDDAAQPGDPNAITQSPAAVTMANTQSSDWVVLSAADPLNLIGIITEHARVPAFAHNRIAFHKGRPVAALVNQEVVLLERLSLTLRDQVAALLTGADIGSALELPTVDEDRPSETTEPPSTTRRKFVRPSIG